MGRVEANGPPEGGPYVLGDVVAVDLADNEDRYEDLKRRAAELRRHL
jgi:hypothetical protein